MNEAVMQPLGNNAKLRKTLKRIQTLFKKNRPDEAKPLCEQAYAQGARDAEFLHVYGLILRACGDLNDALIKIHAAHEETPTDANILNSLGLVFLDMGDAETAIEMFKRATSENEKFYDAWVNLGTTLRGVKRDNAAEVAFTCAHYLDRSKPDPLLKLALIQVDMHKYKRAAEFMDELIKKHKRIPPGLKLMRLQIAMELEDLEYVKQHQSSIDPAILNEEQRIVLDSVKAQYHVIFDQFDESIAILEKTTEKNGPHQADHISHLGFCYGLAGRIDDGIVRLKAMLKEWPDHDTGRHNLALLQFRKGDVAEGFKNYEARLQLKEFASKANRFDAPMWRGEPIDGKSIIVWKEQGIGDEVRYASLLPELRERGCSITLECAEKISPLWKRSFPWATIRSVGKEANPSEEENTKFDFQIPVGSLGSVFRNSIADFDKKQKPWIARNPDAESKIRKQLAIQPDELLVGVCWRSMVQIASRDKVFLNCEQLEVFNSLPNVRWLNVQYASKDEEIETIRKCGLDLHHYVDLDQLDDLVGVCNLLGACDVVVSVGGSVGDLAGGVGTPMIYMTREASEAYLGTDNVPWFPNCKSYPIKAYKADDTLAKVVRDWSSISQWAESFKSEERKASDFSVKGTPRPSLDLEYPIEQGGSR